MHFKDIERLFEVRPGRRVRLKHYDPGWAAQEELKELEKDELKERAREFLEHKDKVIVSVVFRGREIAHVDEGHKVMREVLERLADVAKVESQPSQQGKRIICTLSPK